MKTYSSLPGKERVRSLPCALCQGTSFAQVFSIPYAEYCRCRGCGLVFQHPQPLEEDLLKRYGGEYFSYEADKEEPFFQLMLKGLDDLAFWKEEEGLRKRGGFLDVGCATGRLLLHMARRGWDVEGVEVCGEAAEFASHRGGFPVHTRPLAKLALRENSFSVIHASHLIEHLNDPVSFCREVHRLLLPGGMFYLTTPNIEGLQARIFREKWRSAIPDHLFLFGKKTLIRLLKEGGFRVEGCKTWGGLAAGMGPKWLKRGMDRMAKALGWGDVMILGGRKIPRDIS